MGKREKSTVSGKDEVVEHESAGAHGNLVTLSPDHLVKQGARIPVKLHRRVCLVQTEDAVLAEELLARKKLAQDTVGRLPDRVLWIRPGRADAVVKELHRMAHTPQVLT